MDYNMIISSSPNDGHYSPTATSTPPRPAASSYHRTTNDDDDEEMDVDSTNQDVVDEEEDEDDPEEEEEEDDEDDEDDDDDDDNTTDDTTAIAAGVVGTTTTTPTPTTSSTTTTTFIHATPTLPSLTSPLKSRKVREIGHEAVWSLSTAKPGNGVQQIRDSSVDTYWQSDGGQPHLINIQFAKRVSVVEMAFYLDYNLDESYTPKEMSIRVGMTFHDLVEVKVVCMKEPCGWCVVPLWETVGGDGGGGGSDGGNDNDEAFDDGDDYYMVEDDDDDDEDNAEEETGNGGRRKKRRRKKKKTVRGHFVQVCVTSMHQNGRDTHIRQVKIFGPRNNEELSRRSSTTAASGKAIGATSSGSGASFKRRYGSSLNKKRGEKETWVCGVPKFQTVSMSQFSTIR